MVAFFFTAPEVAPPGPVVVPNPFTVDVDQPTFFQAQLAWAV